MLEALKVWEPILIRFEEDYSHVVDRMVDWYPSGRNEITVVTKDGKYVYNYIERNIKKLGITSKNQYDELNEQIWRKIFSERLVNKMRFVGMEQWRLAQITGISEVSISRYMNGKATPSGYNLDRIADALECSIMELTGM